MKKISEDLLSKLAQAAFRMPETSAENAALVKFLLEKSIEDIKAFIPDIKTRQSILSNAARREKAPIFKQLLEKFKGDGESLEAIFDGYKISDDASRQRHSEYTDADHKNLAAKRAAIGELLLQLNPRAAEPSGPV